jgi:redox-sensitive bicupin YhaK (pirin superfamily)
MIDIRPFASLGTFRNDWLQAHYHFSFSGYQDFNRNNWGALRVWNDDTIRPNTGFDRHGHKDMEIITYVRSGAITHRDHLGNEGRTEAGDVQVMWAGRGILHEEHNRETAPTQIFQLWVLPNRTGITPGWEAQQFPKGERAGSLVTLASGREKDKGALPIHQDASILAATLKPGQSVTHHLEPGRFLYVVPATGSLSVNGQQARARDGIAIFGDENISFTALDAETEILLADVPGI